MTASPDTTARERGFLAGTWLVLAPTLLAADSSWPSARVCSSAPSPSS